MSPLKLANLKCVICSAQSKTRSSHTINFDFQLGSSLFMMTSVLPSSPQTPPLSSQNMTQKGSDLVNLSTSARFLQETEISNWVGSSRS